MSKKELVPNNYSTIYFPSHHRAWKNGYVYEHIIIAEQKLGRELEDGECVHHIDMNKRNNNPNNLMIFDSYRNHVAFHKGGKAIPLDNGTYTVVPLYKYETAEKKDGSGYTIKRLINNKDELKNNQTNHSINICPICNKNFKSIDSNMCLECYNIERSKNIPQKEKLINDFINNNFNKSAIAKIYNVSQKSIQKWCKKYEIKDCLININMSKSPKDRKRICK